MKLVLIIILLIGFFLCIVLVEASDYDYLDRLYDYKENNSLSDDEAERAKQECIELGYFTYPDKFNVTTSTKLKNAVEPKCLSRCLQQFNIWSFETCSWLAGCGQCIRPCLETSRLVASSYYAILNTSTCETFCGGEGKEFEACLASCTFVKDHFYTRADLSCPTPQEISARKYDGKNNWYDVCAHESECYFDDNCKGTNQKCCPSRTDAFFCVDVLPVIASNATAVDNNNSTIQDEEISFVTNVQTNKGHVLLDYKLEYHLDNEPEHATIALFAWKSHTNFSELPSYVFYDFKSGVVGSFEVALEQGYEYKLKLGIYDINGLMSNSNLDSVHNLTFSVDKEVELARVQVLFIEKMKCVKEDDVRFVDETCELTVRWSNPNPQISLPLTYDFEIYSCRSWPLKLTTHDSRLTFELKGFPVCYSQAIFWVTTRTKYFINKSEKQASSNESRFKVIWQHESKCLKWGGESDNASDLIVQLEEDYDVEDHVHRYMKLELNHTLFMSLLNTIQYDQIRVVVESKFCICWSDKHSEKVSYYATLQTLHQHRLKLRPNCGYFIQVEAFQTANAARCVKLKKFNLHPYNVDTKESFPLKPYVSQWFPGNVDKPVVFRGNIVMEIWSMTSHTRELSLDFNQSVLPFDKPPFLHACNHNLYMTLRYDPDYVNNATAANYSDCPDAALKINQTKWCSQFYHNPFFTSHHAKLQSISLLFMLIQFPLLKLLIH